jgi:hypothetical protein
MAMRVLPSSGSWGSEGVLEEFGRLSLQPSSLRPDCHADERIFAWRGVRNAPSSVLNIPVLQHIADLASRASLRETSGYGAGLRKFHLFCDIFQIPEEARLPAPYEVLFAFALWASTTPDPLDPIFADGTLFEPVAVATARKYLSAVRAWHLAQGWPAPLSDGDHDRINWSLRGLSHLEALQRKHPPCPPATLAMLAALRISLNLADPFEAAVWAICSCAFWGLMRFGEATVKTRKDYSPTKHASRASARFGRDQLGLPYAKITLPTAKTAAPGQTQDIFLTQQLGPLCPIEALANLARVVPAHADDPLFSWRDRDGHVYPMIRDTTLKKIRSVLLGFGYTSMYGHSFRIGGALYLLAQGVSPEIVRLMGRWRSLAYKAYIRAFEQVLSRHVGGGALLMG